MHLPGVSANAAVHLIISVGFAASAQAPAAATDSNGVKPVPAAAAKDPQFTKNRGGGPLSASDPEYLREKARAQERIERMRKDAARLLQTATDLKKYVDKTDENVLSLEVIRKAEEMEKLARALKNSMKAD